VSVRRRAAAALDPVTLSVVQGLFVACAEEMGATLMRTAHSPNIKERLDHSCAVFDARGRLVAQAAHIPVHLGSMGAAVRAAMTLAPLAPGDVVLLNDPFAGGTHLPDLTLVSPVWLAPRGGVARAPGFYVASRAHHADVGGGAPGSLPLAREVYEEGLRIPPVRLARSGHLEADLMRLLLANVRTPDERRADLAAQLGAQATGVRRLGELSRRAGPDALEVAARALQDLADAATRTALRALPDGVRRAEDVLDDDGTGGGPVRIAAELVKRGDRLRLDYTRSDDQRAAPINAVAAVTRAAACYAVRCVLGGDAPVNEGTFRALELRTRPGSVLDARPPAAVGAGNVETSQRIVDVTLAAFARLLPGRVPAMSAGTMNNVLIGGVDPRDGRPFAYYETLGGGHGAGPGWDGASALQVHMTNTRNTPIEALEHAYPLRVTELRVRRGSGGRGRFRGGDGITRTLELLAPARVTVVSERRARGPRGLAGGADGKPGVNEVQWRATDRRSRPLPGKFMLELPAGARLTVGSPGGGGWGAVRTPRSARPRTRRRR
jgi:N-methylhydantoinase B